MLDTSRNPTSKINPADPPQEPASVVSEELRFDEVMERQSRDRELGKRERTRAQVLAKVATQLLDSPMKWPSVETVLDETGLSRGTFYNHFTDMNECVEVLLTTFFKSLWKPRSFGSTRVGEKAGDPVFEANLWYCRAYEMNAGMFAAFSNIAANTPSLLLMREEMNAAWVDRVLASSSRRRGRPYSRDQARAFKGELRLLIAMSMEALRERNVHKDAFLLTTYPDVESQAQGLTVLWRRTIAHYEGAAPPHASDKKGTRYHE